MPAFEVLRNVAADFCATGMAAGSASWTEEKPGAGLLQKAQVIGGGSVTKMLVEECGDLPEGFFRFGRAIVELVLSV